VDIWKPLIFTSLFYLGRSIWSHSISFLQCRTSSLVTSLCIVSCLTIEICFWIPLKIFDNISKKRGLLSREGDFLSYFRFLAKNKTPNVSRNLECLMCVLGCWHASRKLWTVHGLTNIDDLKENLEAKYWSEWYLFKFIRWIFRVWGVEDWRWTAMMKEAAFVARFVALHIGWKASKLILPVVESSYQKNRLTSN
jgi:hypothetical protein